MAKVKEENIIETKDAYKIAKEITEYLRLDPEILASENSDVSEHMVQFVIEALKKLSLLKATLHDEDCLELNGYKLDGAVLVVDEVFTLLHAAERLYAETH